MTILIQLMEVVTQRVLGHRTTKQEEALESMCYSQKEHVDNEWCTLSMSGFLMTLLALWPAVNLGG